MVVHACNFSTQEAEMIESSKSARATQWDPVSKKKKKKNQEIG
jgi:hypothetical protein